MESVEPMPTSGDMKRQANKPQQEMELFEAPHPEMPSGAIADADHFDYQPLEQRDEDRQGDSRQRRLQPSQQQLQMQGEGRRRRRSSVNTGKKKAIILLLDEFNNTNKAMQFYGMSLADTMNYDVVIAGYRGGKPIPAILNHHNITVNELWPSITHKFEKIIFEGSSLSMRAANKLANFGLNLLKLILFFFFPVLTFWMKMIHVLSLLLLGTRSYGKGDGIECVVVQNDVSPIMLLSVWILCTLNRSKLLVHWQSRKQTGMPRWLNMLSFHRLTRLYQKMVVMMCSDNICVDSEVANFLKTRFQVNPVLLPVEQLRQNVLLPYPSSFNQQRQQQQESENQQQKNCWRMLGLSRSQDNLHNSSSNNSSMNRSEIARNNLDDNDDDSNNNNSRDMNMNMNMGMDNNMNMSNNMNMNMGMDNSSNMNTNNSNMGQDQQLESDFIPGQQHQKPSTIYTNIYPHINKNDNNSFDKFSNEENRHHTLPDARLMDHQRFSD